jgi:archaellum component FlaF (FlaF/FlaG flagellin family)
MIMNHLYYLIAKLSIALLLFSSGLYYVYNKGYENATAKYSKIITKYENDINVKIDNIEKLSSTLSQDLKNSEVTISRDLKTIIINSRKSPATVIVEGKCLPSEDYKQALRDMRKRANDSIAQEVKR